MPPTSQPPGKTVTQKTDPSFASRVVVHSHGPTALCLSRRQNKVKQDLCPRILFIYLFICMEPIGFPNLLLTFNIHEESVQTVSAQFWGRRLRQSFTGTKIKQRHRSSPPHRPPKVPCPRSSLLCPQGDRDANRSPCSVVLPVFVLCIIYIY